MARKEKKYHFIYKTTNLISGKYYIGMHSTHNLKDGYMGSGRNLRYSIKKYGKDNHKIEVLEFFDNRKDLKKRERDVVNLKEIAKKDCMNIQLGGYGGFINEAHRKKCSDAGNDAFLFRLNNDKEFRERISKETSETNLRLIKEGKLKVPTYDWTGRNHSEESKSKMSESKKGTGIGEKNSQYGTCWITKEGINKKIKKEDLNSFIVDGWKRGRDFN